ncbi:MAG: hypothetical protein PHH00_00725 [Candidatus Nanoarchaeia archaeon]|nr:hypothetical protein [Candidatus Nanoarchaeia archaeon]
MGNELVMSIAQAFNYASIALINIRYFDISQECYEGLKRFYLELHKRAVEAGDRKPWPHNTLPEKLEDAKLLLEFPYQYN